MHKSLASGTKPALFFFLNPLANNFSVKDLGRKPLGKIPSHDWKTSAVTLLYDALRARKEPCAHEIIHLRTIKSEDCKLPQRSMDADSPIYLWSVRVV